MEHAGGFYSEMAGVVTCMACHEASGMDVGPHPDEAMGGIWVPIVSELSRSGEVTTSAVVSHTIQWQVACTRCHFEDNPWDLIQLTEDGQIPEPEEASEG
jgi:cytochrome c553